MCLIQEMLYHHTVVEKKSGAKLHGMFSAKLLVDGVIVLKCGKRRLNVINGNNATGQYSLNHILFVHSTDHEFSHILISNDNSFNIATNCTV